MTNQPKKIQVKETQRYWGDFEGSLESIISSLQKELDDGWEGIEEYLEQYSDRSVPYLYKHREETDKEYEKRMKQLEKEKAEKAKAKEQKLKQLKKDLASLTDEEKELLGLK
jgi:chromosome segregation ATPase